MKAKRYSREAKGERESRPAYRSAMHPEVLDASRAAQVLGISRALLLRLARKGEVPGRKLGKEWRFRLSTLLGWLGKVEPPPPDWLRPLIEKGKVEIGKHKKS